MAITLTYTGTGSFAADVKVDEDRVIRTNLPSGSPVTISNVALSDLDGNEQWEALIARSDITLGLTGESGQTVTFFVDLVDLLAGAADDVTVVASMPFDARITNVEAVVTTGVALSTMTLRDAAGGLGNALSSALDSDGTPSRVADDGALGFPTVTEGTPLILRRSDDGVVGALAVTVVRTG